MSNLLTGEEAKLKQKAQQSQDGPSQKAAQEQSEDEDFDESKAFSPEDEEVCLNSKISALQCFSCHFQLSEQEFLQASGSSEQSSTDAEDDDAAPTNGKSTNQSKEKASSNFLVCSKENHAHILDTA